MLDVEASSTEAAQWKASSGLTGPAGSQVVESTSMAASRVRWPSFGRHLFSKRSIHCCAYPQLEAVDARPCPYEQLVDLPHTAATDQEA